MWIGNLKRHKRMSVSGSPPNPDSLMCRCLAQSMPRHVLRRRAFLQSIVPSLFHLLIGAPRHATYPSLSECAKPPACQLTLSIKGTQTGYRRSECLVRKFCTSEGPRWPWKSVQSLASADAKKSLSGQPIIIKNASASDAYRRRP